MAVANTSTFYPTVLADDMNVDDVDKPAATNGKKTKPKVKKVGKTGAAVSRPLKIDGHGEDEVSPSTQSPRAETPIFPP
jgi:hypothetical protein